MGVRHQATFGIFSIAVLLALAGSGPGVTAQQAPPASTQSEATVGTGVITGLVIAADNALPVRRARVSVAGGPPPPPRTGPVATATLQFAGGATRTRTETFTDASGRFEVGHLPDGIYSINVQPSAGFAAPRPVPPVRILDGKPVAVTIRVERAGAIEGRVLDGDGEPVAYAMVRAMSWANAGGTRRLAWRAGASTNDLGQFRLFGLPAGEYFVSAQAQPMRLRDEAAAPTAGFVPTYYQGTADVAGATPIKVIAGGDVAGIDIPLQTATLVTVAGRVILPGGQAPPAGTQPSVTLVSVTDDQSVPRYGPQDSSSYRFVDVPPGEYLLAASVVPTSGSWSSSDPTPPRPGGIVPVHVGSTNISVDLELNLGATVSGIVRVEGQAPAADTSVPGSKPIDAPSAPTVAPRLVTSSGSIMMAFAPGRPVQASEDGSFVLTGLRGQFLFNASGPGALKSVRLNGRDVTGTPIELAGTENLDGLEVTLTRDVGVIRGRVLGQDGQPYGQALVMAIPTERERVFPLSPFVKSTGTVDTTLMPSVRVPAGESNPMRTAEVRSTGDFTLPPLVAGRYRLVAYDRTTGPVGIPDIEEIRRIAATGTAVTVDSGKTLAVDVKLSQWPGSPAK
jgi:hypothetical protein